MSAVDKALRLRIGIAFAIVYLVWGSTYLAIRLAIDTIPPLLMGGTRFLVAGGLLTLWCALRREPGLSRLELRNAAITGLAMVTIGNGLVTLAEQTVPSGLAALLVAVGPAMTVVLLWLGLGPGAEGAKVRRRPTPVTIAGLALGLGGVGLLVAGGSAGRVDPLGAGLIVLATLGWSWGALFTQRVGTPASPLRANAVGMLAGGGVVFVTGLLRGETRALHLERITPASFWALAYLVVFGSLIAYSAYYWLLRHVSATAAGTSAYVNPAVAVGLGALWGEPVGPRALGAMALILGGVYLLKRESAAKPVAAPISEEPRRDETARRETALAGCSE